MKTHALVATAIAVLLLPSLSWAQSSSPAPPATSQASEAPATGAPSPFAIPVGRDIGYRVEIAQTFGAEWVFTGSLVFQADSNGKITGGYLGDTDQENPTYPQDPMLGRLNPVLGTITPDNKINMVIGSGSLQWTITGKVSSHHIKGNTSTGRFGLMTFYATRVHIPKHTQSSN